MNGYPIENTITMTGLVISGAIVLTVLIACIMLVKGVVYFYKRHKEKKEKEVKDAVDMASLSMTTVSMSQDEEKNRPDGFYNSNRVNVHVDSSSLIYFLHGCHDYHYTEKKQ